MYLLSLNTRLIGCKCKGLHNNLSSWHCMGCSNSVCANDVSPKHTVQEMSHLVEALEFLTTY